MAVGSYESAASLARDLTGGQKFMKFVILGLNVVYLIFGIVLCALGGAALGGYAASIAGSTLPKGLIVIGAFLIVTAIVGGLSAWFEVRVGLGFYFAAMLIWTIILLAIGIAVLAEKNNLQSILAKGWAYADCGTQHTIQANFMCCGRFNESDFYIYGQQGWNSNTDWVSPNGNPFTMPTDTEPDPNALFPTFPSIHCSGGGKGCPGQFTKRTLDGQQNSSCVGGTNVFTGDGNGMGPFCETSAQGCVNAMQSSLESNWQAAGGAGIAFAVLMALGLAFTVLLIKGIGTKTQNAAIERNRVKTQRDIEEKRRRGKGGLRIPDTVL